MSERNKRIRLQDLQHREDLALRFYAPIWKRFVDAEILSRRLTLPPGTVPESLYFPKLRPPSLPWIDLYGALLAADAYPSPAGGATAETSSTDASAANPNDEDEEEEAA